MAHYHRPPRRSRLRVAAAAVLAPLAAALLLASCADPAAGPSGASTVRVGAVAYDLSAHQSHVTVAADPRLVAELPAAVRASGTLVVGSGSAGAGTPPLAFTADDDRTPIGVEVDIAHLVASRLGLRPEIAVTSWENLFLGLDSGRYQVGISNIGVSEARKQKYDFATYRLGLHAFEAKAGTTLRVSGPADISGRTVGVSSGTLQEAILLRWNAEDEKAGRPPAQLRYYQSSTDYYLALQSGRLDLFLGPNPVATYHVATAKQTQIVGTVSSSFPLTGLVGIATKKGDGLAQPLADALDASIADGTYARVLAKWGLQGEAVDHALVNPPGLPVSATR